MHNEADCLLYDHFMQPFSIIVEPCAQPVVILFSVSSFSKRTICHKKKKK